MFRSAAFQARLRLIALPLFIVLSHGVSAAEFWIEIKQGNWELKPGLTIAVGSYGGTVPGTPIVARAGGLQIIGRLVDDQWESLP